MRKVSDRQFRVGIVGTGYIADAHMEVLSKEKNVTVVACSDINLSKAERFSSKWGIQHSYKNLNELLKENLDILHILVPPDQHYNTAKEAIQNKVNVFIEKPMTAASQEAYDLIYLAEQNNVQIGTNHNARFHPLFLRLQQDLNKNTIGGLSRVVIYQTGPLGQLDFGKYSHWMFQSPKNIVFELASHPISQIRELLGDVKNIQATALGKRELTPGQFFYNCWNAIAECEKGVAILHISFGNQYFPQNRIIASGQDGSILIDQLNNLYLIQEKSSLPDYLDPLTNAIKYSHCLSQGVKNFANYVFSKLKLRDRSDVFYLGMKNSLDAFYDAFLKDRKLISSGIDGAKVVEFCEKFAEAARPVENLKINLVPSFATKKRDSEILVTGANGLIGSDLVNRLTAQGKKVRALVRSSRGLKDILRSPLVEVINGDITDKKLVEEAVKGVKYVYHLAHSLGDSEEEFYANNVEPSMNIAELCLKEKVKYFIFTSTIATYNYGNISNGKAVTEEIGIDPKYDQRNYYARSKIIIENMLLKMAKDKGLPVIIFRPGIVIGEGGILYHGGVGQWTRDNKCSYWGMGKNKLPFVLVEDVSSALIKVLEVDGLEGQVFNLCGDVALSAREYVNYLIKYSKRPIKANSYPMSMLCIAETFKYLIKYFTGQKNNALLSYRDLRNRSIPVLFNCDKAKKFLSWQSCNNQDLFIKKGIGWAFENKGNQ